MNSIKNIGIIIVALWGLYACQETKSTKEVSTENVSYKPKVSLSFDDPHHYETPLYTGKERDSLILATLRKEKLQAALFVCGKRVDHPDGKQMIRDWATEHWVANHTYSHYYYHSSKIDYATYAKDVLRGDSLLAAIVPTFEKYFRYPYLKEGNTAVKRDSLYALLDHLDYKLGHVSIDASDWYVDRRLKKQLEQDSMIDLAPYRDFYIQHILERATYYDSLARVGHQAPIKHVLLLHHNLVNALFLGDLIDAFKASGWEMISVEEAYQDPFYQNRSTILPAGESLIWSKAKERGDTTLRYPAEDGRYEEAKMDKLGL